MTATGIDDDGDPPTTVTADCEFGVETLDVGVTMDRFTVSMRENPYVETRCY